MTLVIVIFLRIISVCPKIQYLFLFYGLSADLEFTVSLDTEMFAGGCTDIIFLSKASVLECYFSFNFDFVNIAT